jgi:glyoxylase-like metal-dependent hydrolase (beta-lactamase superfamily II)
MTVQLALPEIALATSQDGGGGTHEIAPNLAYLRTVLVNVIFVGMRQAGPRQWVLVDAGILGSAKAIRDAAEARFGKDAPPAAILMTHGHFDHVGALEELSRDWDVPVYAHPVEAPYLTGRASYPPSDPKADGGIMPKLSPLFPRTPVDISERLVELPADGSVPFLHGWHWIATPGHTPGHVSFWNETSRCLIAGDAFITTGQESAYEVAMQTPEMHGPPRYFTPDWTAAAASVRRLAALRPDLVITGHGRAVAGPNMLAALDELAENFERLAPPEHLRMR